MPKLKLSLLSMIGGLTLISSSAYAGVDAEVSYILNTLLFLIGGFLVMWMAAGFAMLESGLVTSKSVSTIAAKNIGLYAISGLMFWLVGYNLATVFLKEDLLEAFFLGVMQVLLKLVTLMVLIGFFKWYSVQQLVL